MPPPRFVLWRGASRPTSALSSSLRAWVISAGGASVSTSVEKTTTPQKSPGARWSTSFITDCLAKWSFSPAMDPETSRTGITQTGGRGAAASRCGAARETTRWTSFASSKRTFSYVSWAVVFMRSEAMGGTDTRAPSRPGARRARGTCPSLRYDFAWEDNE